MLDRDVLIGWLGCVVKFQVFCIFRPSRGSGVPDFFLFLLQDDLTRLAEVMIEFWRRNEKVVVGVKKVGIHDGRWGFSVHTPFSSNRFVSIHH